MVRLDTSASLSAVLEPALPVRLQTEPYVKVQEVKRPSEANNSRQRGDSALHARPAESAPPKSAPPAGAHAAASSGRLTIAYDQEAGRFIQRLIDPATDEILRQFPHDSQLMMARAQKAYQAAVSEQQKLAAAKR